MLSYMKDLKFDLVLPNLKATSREQALHLAADAVAKHIKVSGDLLFQGLAEKRRVERSCVGEGLAIADLKIRGLQRPFMVLTRFSHDVDFQAMDKQPVNLMCIVLSPERDGPIHLRRVARVSRLLKNSDLQQKLREASNEDAMRSLLIDPEGWMLAA